MIESRHTPWESITFSGARHEVTIDGRIEPETLAIKLKSISEDVFQLRGHILADIIAKAEPHPSITRIVVEALTVESA